MTKKIIWCDANGQEYTMQAISDNHLVNIIRHIELRTQNGMIIQSGGGDSPENFWHDEDYLTEEEAKKKMNYHLFTQELMKRRKNKK